MAIVTLSSRRCDDDHDRRTDSTPATFANYWSEPFVENGTSAPVAEPAVVTVFAEYGWVGNKHKALECVRKAVRECGLICTAKSLLSDHVPVAFDKKGKSKSRSERVSFVVHEGRVAELRVCTPLTGGLNDEQSRISLTDELVGRLDRQLTEDDMFHTPVFVRHEEIEIETKSCEFLPGGAGRLVLRACTGGGEHAGELSTMYSLSWRSNGHVIAKAICKYHNNYMRTVGPTLEYIEVAKEYQKKGVGSRLLEAIEEHMRDVFRGEYDDTYAHLSMSACEVTNDYASKWLQARGYKNVSFCGDDELIKEIWPCV